MIVSPDPGCGIGCHGDGTIRHVYKGEPKLTPCACNQVVFISEDLEETMSALQDAMVIQIEEKDALDKSST